MGTFRHVKFCLSSFTKHMQLKQKFLLHCVLGMIIPVVAVDLIVICNIQTYQRREQRQQLSDAIATVLHDFSGVMEQASYFSSSIINDKELAEYLASEYQSAVSSYEAYSSLSNRFILNGYRYIREFSNVTIYVDNPTIAETEHIKQMDEVTRKSWWYQRYVNAESDIYCFEDITRNAGSGINPYAGTISYIRRFTDVKERECILVRDLNYNQIYHIMLDEVKESEIYICNDNRILFASNTDIYKGAELQEPVVQMIDSKGMFVKQEVPAVTEGWTCYAKGAKKSLLSVATSAKMLVVVLIVISLLLPTIVINILVNNIVSRLHILECHFDGLLNEQLEKIPVEENVDEIGRLFQHYNGCVDKIKQLIETVVQKNDEKHALEVTKKQAELNALNTQVNPHFMYNTLQCICMRSLIKGEKETADIIRCLSVLLRQMSKWDKDVVTIEEELSFVEKYLAIQKYRFAEKIAYEVRMEDNVRNLSIPKLTLVSFVENACVHGIEESLEDGVVSVTASATEEKLIIVIQDTGCGMDDDTVQELIYRIEVADVNMLLHSKSTGVLNAVMRLKMYFGDKLSFHISSVVNEGTRIEISIQRDIR